MDVHGALSSQQRRAVERIKQSQQRLDRLVSEVLNFAKVEAGQVSFHVRPVAVADSVTGVRSLVDQLLRAKRIELTLEAVSGLTAFADSEKLDQILLNLLTNAIKFTPEGGRVRIGGESAEGRVRIHVEDNGRGIPAERLEAIFEPFEQAHTSADSMGEGFGLGLAISRELARGMSGELSAVSREGQGSTFTIELPEHA